MSERLSAEIWIGGDVKADQVDNLCDAICDEGASVDWGDRFEPQNADELLEALTDHGGVLVIQLTNEQASWGEFAGLEGWLRENGLPYTRRSENTGCYDAELVEFRPGRELVSVAANADGQPVVTVEAIRKVEQLLKKAQHAVNGKRNAKTLLAEALELLGTTLPAKVRPLPPFRLVP
jgi:hypothetical protein